MDLTMLTVASPSTAIAERTTTATHLAEGFYKKIEAEDGDVHAYLTLAKERALAQAARIDALAGKGDPLPPLAGVPVAVKDVMVTRGVRSTAGSQNPGNYVPPYDATAGARLGEAGAGNPGQTKFQEICM